jgi:hypothetical protein
VFAALGATLMPAIAAANDWDPGHRTTATLPREIDPDREHPATDGVYGRFAGAFDWSLGAGGGYGDAPGSGFVLTSTTLHWFSLLGAYAAFREVLDASESGLERAVSGGVEVKPLFLLRWSENLERGPALLDLTLDSLALGVGARAARHAGRWSSGVETSLAVGAPLTGEANGLWARVRGSLLLSPGREVAAQIDVALEWHVFFDAPWEAE